MRETMRSPIFKGSKIEMNSIHKLLGLRMRNIYAKIDDNQSRRFDVIMGQTDKEIHRKFPLKLSTETSVR